MMVLGLWNDWYAGIWVEIWKLKKILYIDEYLEASLSNQPKFGKGAPSKLKLKLKVTGGAILLLQPWLPNSGVGLTNENTDLAFWGKWYL